VWRHTTTITMALAATALAGCAVQSIHSGGQKSFPDRNEVPIASNFPTSTQLKLQAAEHWRRVANTSADALVRSLKSNGACVPNKGCATLYLRRSCETTGCAPQACETTFNRVFHNDFLTALLTHGYQVSTVPAANAPVVDLDIQAVSFAHNRPQYRYAGQPVELGPGIWALRDVISLMDKSGAETRRTLDHDTNWFRTEFAAGPTPRNELVITVSATSGANTYLARNTAVYYTADADAAHYICGVTAGRSRTWSIPVIGDCTAPSCRDAGGVRQ
jgi:hypothetical protein